MAEQSIGAPPHGGTGRERARIRLTGVVDGVADRVDQIDATPRTMAVGGALAVFLATLMALGVDRELSIVSVVAVGLAAFAPTAGLTIVAGLVVFREPAGVGALGFQASIVGACALGTVARLVLRNRHGAVGGWRAEFLAIGTFIGLSTFQFLSIATKVADDRERFARAQLTDVASGLVLVMLAGVMLSARTRPWLVVAMLPGVLVAAITAVASLDPGLLAALPVHGLLPLQDVSARGTGIFVNPNYLGQAMAFSVLLIGTSSRLHLPGWLGRRGWMLALAPLAALVASFSRGAMIGFVAGAVSLYIDRGRKVLGIAAVTGILALVVGYPLLLNVRHSLIFGPAIAASDAAQDASDQSRVAIHVAGLRMFLRQPLLGIGYGQFRYESPKYMRDSVITYPHDDYLQVVAEQGIVGITVYLTALAAILLALVRRADPYARTARAMFVALAVGSLFAEPLTSPQTSTIVWIMVGAALIRREQVPDPHARIEEPAWLREQYRAAPVSPL